MDLVEFRDVSYSVGPTNILSNLNLTVNEGEIVVLLGESGCGKTTTLKLVNRLLEPTSGQVLVEDKTTTDWDPIALRRRIGYVIQEGGLFPHFTIERNVGLVPRLSGWDEPRTNERARELLELLRRDTRDFTLGFQFDPHRDADARSALCAQFWRPLFPLSFAGCIDHPKAIIA